jgi:hypothetical protein
MQLTQSRSHVLTKVSAVPLLWGLSRCQQEPMVLTPEGGNDGLDSERQKERVASENLLHRRCSLEDLALQL